MSQIKELIEKLCPNGVEWKALGEVGEFIRGNGLQKSDFVDNGIGCIHYGQIHTTYNISTDKTLSFVTPELSQKLRKAKYGDLIIATTSEDVEACCKAIAWLGNEEVAISGDSYIYRHNQNPLYITYLYQTENFQHQKRMAATGTKVVRVSGDSMANFKIPLPPLEVQNRIVDILDHFTNLTANLTSELNLRRKQFEHYREKLLSLDGVLGVEWKTLGKVCKKVSKIKWNAIPSDVEFVYVDLSSVDIKTHKISQDYIITPDDAPNRAQQIIETEDILFATTRPTQMRYCIIPDNLNNQICSTGYCVIRSNRNCVLPRWIMYLVSTIEFFQFVNEHQQGAGYPSISDNVLFSFHIPVPPLNVQQSIVQKLDKFTSLIENIERELDLRQKQFEYYREQLLSF